MSDFLKLAFELISQIVYNIVAWVVGIFKGFSNIFIAGLSVYSDIFNSYFKSMSAIPKFFSILLVIVLIAIPIGLIVLLVRHIIINVRLKAQADDNVTLYKEIGRLNKQVMNLMDEKNMILAMKTGLAQDKAASYVDQNGTEVYYEGSGVNPRTGVPAGAYGTLPGQPAGAIPAPVYGATEEFAGMADPLSETAPAMAQPAYAGGVAGGATAVAGGMAFNAEANIGDDAISSAAAAAAVAAAQARSKAEEQERNAANRFPKLHAVDLKYDSYEYPEFNDSVTLEQFAEGFRLFACSQMHLYYTPEIVRRFIAGMASSKILILEGISGTGKTSLPYSFSRYIDNPATIVSVQPSYKDRTELLGYFNEFSKRFNETEFLRALYEANYRLDPTFIVLDEMNLARIEYYFAEMLSVLEMPDPSEWVIDLVPTAWLGDPVKMSGGKILVKPNTWFVGTANNDDSTFTITDKVYDRAITIELNERAAAFECPPQSACCVTATHLQQLFMQAKEEHPISDSTLAKMLRLDEYLQTRFRLAFGNRITKQMHDFIPVYVACGGTELDGMDYILARKILKKFESLNISFVRDEIKGLIAYFEKVFGKSHMQDSKSYLQRIQNLY